MSSRQSYSYASATYSSSSSTDPSGTTKRYTEEGFSNDRDGTTIRRTQEGTGNPTLEETSYFPPGGGRIGERGEESTAATSGRKIEEVSDAGREYEERMEDEYAKREGGA